MTIEEMTKRVIELESQLAFQQESIDSLSEMVAKQWAVMERQQKLIKQMDDQIYTLESQAGISPSQERPPHY